MTLTIARDYEPERVVGIDIDSKLVSIARKNIRHYQVGPEVCGYNQLQGTIKVFSCLLIYFSMWIVEFILSSLCVLSESFLHYIFLV